VVEVAVKGDDALPSAGQVAFRIMEVPDVVTVAFKLLLGHPLTLWTSWRLLPPLICKADFWVPVVGPVAPPGPVWIARLVR
jgi:hypothetical protein